jgi:hypothetical protein
LPLITDIQDKVWGAKWFTKLDIKDAYHRVQIHEGDEWKTAFRTKFGHFKYLVMPMGLINAPALWQRLINKVLYKYLFIFMIVYLDDILIFLENMNKHV